MRTPTVDIQARSPRSREGRFAFRVSLLALTVSLPAAADPPFILIDRDLRERRVELAAITDRAISFVDELGLARTEPLDSQLALLRVTSRARFDAASVPGWYERFLRLEVQPEEPRIDESAPGTLVLTDGQRLAGRLADAPAADGRLRWEHPLFGTLDVDLERVRAVAFEAPWTDRPSPVDDTITLVNGDRVQGFVEHIGPEIVVDAGGSRSAIAASRVASVELANPRAPLGGPVVWLSDGSVLALSAITVAITGRAELASADVAGSAGPVASVSAAQIAAIAFDADARGTNAPARPACPPPPSSALPTRRSARAISPSQAPSKPSGPFRAAHHASRRRSNSRPRPGSGATAKSWSRSPRQACPRANSRACASTANAPSPGSMHASPAPTGATAPSASLSTPARSARSRTVRSSAAPCS